MTRTSLAAALLLSMGVSNLAASGPLSAALAREAARLAAAQPASDDAAWQRVRKLDRGTAIDLMTTAHPPARRVFVGADERGLTALNLTDPSLPRSVIDVLIETARAHPQRFDAARAGAQVTTVDGIHLKAEGVFVGTRRVAEWSGLLESAARDEVIRIADPTTRRGSLLAAALGAAGGLALALGAVVPGLGYKRCGASCNDEGALILISIVGLPAAGGLAAYYGTSSKSQRVTYDRALR